MHFERSGSGRPALVFVHGYGCALDDWRAQMKHFGTRHEVVACDLRAHGATPGSADESNILNFGGDVAALVANLDLKGAVLVGHSMGCRVVLEAARQVPERTGGIVLVDGSMNGTSPAIAEAALRALHGAPTFAAFAAGLFGGMFLEESPLSRAVVARAQALPAETGTRIYESLVKWDVEHMRAALAAVRSPLMAVQTTMITPERKRVPLKHGQTMPWLDLVREQVPKARVEIIPDSGHFPQLERVAELNALIEDFLAGLR
jgi:pimeloyl-ACP methyl ester carboxylesterase